MQCAADGCERKVLARGLCQSHYKRARRGTPFETPVRSVLRGASVADRLRRKVVVDAAGCWVWAGCKNHAGYGRIQCDGRARPAHRVSWEIQNGPIPEGLFVCHRCDNPPCCNPDHLFLGTADANMADMVAKGRSLVGDRNPRARLPGAKFGEVRASLASGLRQVDVAAKFSVSQSFVSAVARGVARK